jgi:transcriptional regulator
MKTNRITRVKEVQIIALRDEGYTHQHIARVVQCHRNTVGTVLRKAGLK